MKYIPIETCTQCPSCKSERVKVKPSDLLTNDIEYTCLKTNNSVRYEELNKVKIPKYCPLKDLE